MERYDILVVGAGAAGMAASVAAYDAGCRNILLVDRAPTLGGVLLQCLHHGFGLTTFGNELTGPEYALRMSEQLQKTNAKKRMETHVISITSDKTALLSNRNGLYSIAFDQLILASGCREKPIGALPISGTRPSGIFTAGQAQEMIHLRHQDLGNHVLILGSGDLGMIMAQRFALEGKHVIAVVEQKPHYSGLARNYHRCIEPYKIPLLCSATITEIRGDDRITGVTLQSLNTGKCQYLPCDTLITAVGLVPDQELVQDLEDLNWVHLSGNCNRVHSIVDSAVSEASMVGERAYQNIKFQHG